jgi:hypothetical protein
MTRILISLGVSVGIFIIIMIIGFIVVGRTGNQLHLQIFSFAGLVFSIGFLIYFAVLGWLPAWILILMMLVSAGIIVLIVRSMVTGGNGG